MPSVSVSVSVCVCAHVCIFVCLQNVRGTEESVRPYIPEIAKFVRTVIADVDGMPEEERQLGRIPAIVKQIAGLIGCGC